MKRNVPLILAFFTGVLVLISEFIPHRPFSQIVDTLQNWFLIIFGFSILIGLISLIRVNISKIQAKAENWPYYIAGLVSFALIVIAGILWGM